MKKLHKLSKITGALLVAGLLTLLQSAFSTREVEELASSRILFNGQPLTVATMTLDARGVLTVITNNFALTKVETVPFRVSLRRGELLIKQAEAQKNQEGVEISKLLVAARQGDQLVIEPLGENRQIIQNKVILLAGYKVYYWFPIPGMMKGEGC